MEASLEDRIATVFERRRTRLDDEGQTSPTQLEHRIARSKVLGALPQLLLDTLNAVSELNDMVCEFGITAKLDGPNHSPSSEAIYIITFESAEEIWPSVFITVNYSGQLACMLNREGQRSLLYSSTVFEVQRSNLLDVMVSALEAKYS